MRLKSWEKLPENMRNDKVSPYYTYLSNKKISLYWKRILDVSVALAALILLSPLFLIISIKIKVDSKGPIFFRQTRITQYGKEFKILKFRTMVINAEKLGSQVTTKEDPRVTRIGHILRKYRLDEIPQLINILVGEMTFVGTRPEVPKYVSQYTNEMYATLLLPAGVTSMASIKYKDEEKLLENTECIDETYTKVILPQKMKWNLKAIMEFGIWKDFTIILKTIIAMMR